MRIFTSNRPSRVDDVIAACLVKSSQPDAAIVPVSEEQAQHFGTQSATDIFINVGGIYDPERGYFDHRRDASLPCASATLAARYGSQALGQSQAARFIATMDLRGFDAAVSETGHQPGARAMGIESMLPLIEIDRGVAASVSGAVRRMEGGECFEWVLLSIWSNLPPKAKADAMAIANASKKAMTVKTFDFDGVRAIVLDQPCDQVTSIMFDAWADVAVVPDRRIAGRTRIIKNLTGPHARRIDLAKAAAVTGRKPIIRHDSAVVLDGAVANVLALLDGIVLSQTEEAARDASRKAAEDRLARRTPSGSNPDPLRDKPPRSWGGRIAQSFDVLRVAC